MGKTETALEVIVDQKVGIITWNFEQLKTALAEKMKEYEGLVYTEETVPIAKQDVATLRKLKKSVSDKRIEIKKKCLEPYEVIEKQASELTELLDKPINQIAKQLDEYEEIRRNEARLEILAYMEKKFLPALPKNIATKLSDKIYDERWEDATVSKKTWKQSIDDAFGRTQGDLVVLDDVEEEFKDKAMNIYSINLVLSEAMSKVTELRHQRDEIIAREMEKKAEEERKKAERKVIPISEGFPAPSKEDESEDRDYIGSVIDEALEESEDVPVVEREAPPKGKTKIYTLRISATPEQIYRIKGYIEHSGAVYREEV